MNLKIKNEVCFLHTPESKKINTDRSLFLRMLLAGFALATSSCGMLDVYKNKEKRCKLNCTAADSNANGSAEPFNFDLTYWNQTTPRSKLDPASEVASLLRGNPFKLTANALKTLSDDINDAKQSISAAEKSAQAECLKEVFSAAFSKDSERTDVKLDYGRCVDLLKLADRLNSNRNTDKDGKLKIIELGSALQMTLKGSIPLIGGGDALHDAGNAFELGSSLPFRTVKTADLLDPSEQRSFSIHFIRGSVQGTALERASNATVLKKSWGFLFAGLEEQQPLKLDWSPALGQMKLNGSLATLSASFQRPTTQTQWDSFGYSREYIFTDFTLSTNSLELGPQLGWTEQTSMSGSYYLRINGDLVGTGGSGSQLYRMQGLGRPCLLNVTFVTGFDGQVPVEQSVGQISLCSTAP